MPASPADSALYRNLLGDDETARLFTDSAEVRAMLLVEGSLAEVQGKLGLIPEDAAYFIKRASLEVEIDPSSLAQDTAINGVPVPAFVAAFRKAMNGPDMAQYLHWGATSQDIMDTALTLRLRRVLDIWDGRLAQIISALSSLAETYSDLPMAARTYGQVATPTSFGQVVASWGWPILRHRARLFDLRRDLLQVSLGGAVGTLSAMGPKAPQVRADLAKALGLADPGHSWHANRDGIAAFAGWMSGLVGTLGKMGEDLFLMTQSGIGEVTFAAGAGSTSMPQEQNPIGPSVMVALSRQVIALSGLLQGAALHRQQRDGAAWLTEWLALPQICISTGAALAQAGNLLSRLEPNAVAMAAGLVGSLKLFHAETVCFALAETMPRPQAEAIVKTLCIEANTHHSRLADLVARDFPARDWSDVMSATLHLGQAPTEARAFAKACR